MDSCIKKPVFDDPKCTEYLKSNKCIIYYYQIQDYQVNLHKKFMEISEFFKKKKSLKKPLFFSHLGQQSKL